MGRFMWEEWNQKHGTETGNDDAERRHRTEKGNNTWDDNMERKHGTAWNENLETKTRNERTWYGTTKTWNGQMELTHGTKTGGGRQHIRVASLAGLLRRPVLIVAHRSTLHKGAPNNR